MLKNVNFLVTIFFKILIFDGLPCNFMQGWRLVSPHFTTLLESAIFPALVLNEKVRIYLNKSNMDSVFA